MSKLEAALEAAKIVPVIPIASGQKGPALVRDWPNKASQDPEVIRKWWTIWAEANIGLLCDGLIVIDEDPRNGGDADTLKLPPTRTHRSASGGRHFFFRLPAGHPGVGNQGGKDSPLGSGLDVKTDGGYVVAPGSRLESGGSYTVLSDAPIVDAPAGLLARLAAKSEREPATSAERAAVLERVTPETIEHLRSALHALDEDNYATWQTVGSNLRCLGEEGRKLWKEWSERSPKSLTCDLDAKWDVLGGERSDYRAVFEKAQETGWQNPGKPAPPSPAEIAAMFSAVEQSSAGQEEKPSAEQPRKRFELMGDIDIAADLKKPWLVENFLQPGKLSSIYGEPGAGKSVLCLDLAHSIATGRQWLEQFVTLQGAVLYVAIEAYGPTRKRLVALRRAHGGNAPIALASGDFNLRTKAGCAELNALLNDTAAELGPLSLVIVDTWARLLSLAGANENLAADVGPVVKQLERIAEVFQTHVAVIHHAGKNRANGARGSNSLVAAVDTELEIAGHTIETKKQRDADEHPKIGFKIVPQPIGERAGKPVTAPVVKPAPVSCAGTGKLTTAESKAFSVLCDMSPNNAPVKLDAWRQACIDDGGWLNDDRRSFSKIKSGLQKGRHIVIDAKGKRPNWTVARTLHGDDGPALDVSRPPFTTTIQ